MEIGESTSRISMQAFPRSPPHLAHNITFLVFVNILSRATKFNQKILNASFSRVSPQLGPNIRFLLIVNIMSRDTKLNKNLMQAFQRFPPSLAPNIIFLIFLYFFDSFHSFQLPPISKGKKKRGRGEAFTVES